MSKEKYLASLTNEEREETLSLVQTSLHAAQLCLTSLESSKTKYPAKDKDLQEWREKISLLESVINKLVVKECNKYEKQQSN